MKTEYYVSENILVGLERDTIYAPFIYDIGK